MAYVRRTELLVNDVQNQIRHMCLKALGMYTADQIVEGNRLHEDLCEAIMAEAWSLKPELREMTPDAWCSYSKGVFVQLLGANPGAHVAVNCTTGNPKKLRLPRRLGESYYREDIKVRPEHQTEALRDWVADEIERDKKRNEINAQYDLVGQQVVAYLNTKTSLNAALKDMPELEMYVPAKYLKKLSEPTEKRANASAEDAAQVFVDRDQLAALAIAHRITTAAV